MDMESCVSTEDKNGLPYNVRLKRARELRGKSPEEIASIVGMSALNYRDLEDFPGDITTGLSLSQLAKLASALAIRTDLLFEDIPSDESNITREHLSSIIAQFLSDTGTAVTDFEDRTGFIITPALNDASEILNWNLDCLRCVCREIGIDWTRVLRSPRIFEKP